jgi:hypothetical protein
MHIITKLVEPCPQLSLGIVGFLYLCSLFLFATLDINIVQVQEYCPTALLKINRYTSYHLVFFCGGGGGGDCEFFFS